MSKLDTAIKLMEDLGGSIDTSSIHIALARRNLVRLVKAGFISPDQGEVIHQELVLILAKLGVINEELCMEYCALNEEHDILSLPVFSGPCPKEEL